MRLGLALTAGFSPFVAGTPQYETMWEKFKLDYKKTYSSTGDEEQVRFQTFKANVDIVAEANSKHLSYSLGINAYSDLTSDEFVKARMGFKMPTPAQQYEGATFLGNHSWAGEDLPASIDWTAKGAVTPIKDQGHCGSCWIFSAVGALEGAYEIATGTLVSLAEQQILDCDHSIFPPTLGCKGGSMGPVFNYAEKNELCTMKSYPYHAAAGKCSQSACVAGVPKGKVTGWKGLALIGKFIPASYKNMMSAVAQQPVSVSIAADHDVFHHYSSGVVDGDCGQMPDHGVLVVGYGTDPDHGDYWKIKNSWGPSWGEKGFVRIKRGGSWRGECAVLNSPSYPVASRGTDEVVV